jgi:hypothetical protein
LKLRYARDPKVAAVCNPGCGRVPVHRANRGLALLAFAFPKPKELMRKSGAKIILNTLYLVQAHVVVSPVVKLGGPC